MADLPLLLTVVVLGRPLLGSVVVLGRPLLGSARETGTALAFRPMLAFSSNREMTVFHASN